LRESYFGYALADYGTFDTELVSKIIYDLKRGKALDISGLTAEHLIQAHPILPVILSKLFRLCVLCKHVPLGFGHSYIVPLPKVKECTTKSLNCEDFRGIAISPVVSKIFENCLLAKLGDFFATQNNQFGFKKGLGCNHAIYTVHRVVENFVNGGNTVNLCSIDISKAFDKVNNHALFMKLMKRNLPLALLDLLENWLQNWFFVYQMESCFSDVFAIRFCVRQGSVLSPFLFAIYLDDIPVFRSLIPRSFVVMYADDIMIYY